MSAAPASIAEYLAGVSPEFRPLLAELAAGVKHPGVAVVEHRDVHVHDIGVAAETGDALRYLLLGAAAELRGDRGQIRFGAFGGILFAGLGDRGGAVVLRALLRPSEAQDQYGRA